LNEEMQMQRNLTFIFLFSGYLKFKDIMYWTQFDFLMKLD